MYVRTRIQVSGACLLHSWSRERQSPRLSSPDRRARPWFHYYTLEHFFQTDLCTIWPCPGHLILWLHVFNKKFALALCNQKLFIGSKSFHFSSTVSTLALTISVIWWKPILKRCLSRTGAGALLCSWPVHPSSRICLKRFQTRLNLVLPSLKFPWSISILFDYRLKNCGLDTQKVN